MKKILFVAGIMVSIIALSSSVCMAQVLNSVKPSQQRVHEYIILRGSGFGNTQGNSQVRFTDGLVTINGGKALLWRDDYIQIRVPVGNRISGTNMPIPKTPLQVSVAVGGGSSASRPFQVITTSTGSLAYEQLTDIDTGPDVDNSRVLGTPNLNSGRTKDADIGDVNNDGYPDIMDNNSNNVANNTHAILHVNNQDKTLRAIRFEPLDATDSGTFVSTITSSEFFGNAVTYDSDLADINNDGLVDLIQTATMGGGTNRVRIHINDSDDPGTFQEQTSVWLPGLTLPTDIFPDDIATGDVNADGFLDFLVTLRERFVSASASITKVFLNDNGTRFIVPSVANLTIPPGPERESTHDGFFIDANADGFLDIILCNELGPNSQLYLHNGNNDSPTYSLVAAGNSGISRHSAAGESADLNGDGFADFVLSGSGAWVYFNDPDNPGSFTETVLPITGGGLFYDIEFGDLDLDGDVDVIGARITATADDTVKVWLNNGDGTFDDATNPGTSALLPDPAPYERLSADLLDLDQDGDLDMYITGADGQNVGLGFGKVPNQLYENKLVDLNILTPLETRPAYAGTNSQGRKVLLRIHYDKDVPGLGPGSFIILVDGTQLPSTDTVVASKIEGEYWLLVNMPTKTNGLYDMEVALNSNPAIRDKEKRSLEYDDARYFDRVLSIDRTRSMNHDDKMESAQAAGKLFVDLSENDDQIGVVSFKRDSDDGNGIVEQGEIARPEYGMVPAQIGIMDQRPAARGAVDSTVPDGMPFFYETSIGGGLKEALTMINAAGDPDHEREIILISDGRENLAPHWERPDPPGPVMPEVLANDPPVTVHTVAIGSDAVVEVLQDIAISTGGTFHNLFEGSGSFFLLSRLADTYKVIDETIRGEQRFFYQEGFPDNLHGKFKVDPGVNSLSVIFHWNQDNAVKQVILIGPDGKIMSHDPPDVTTYGDPKHQTYRVRKPAAGTWQYRVAGQRRDDVEFFAVASAVSDLVIIRGPISVQGNGGIFKTVLRVVLADAKPIVNASVVATITLPNREKTKLKFFDDGKHGDGRANDGLYGAIYLDKLSGAYAAQIVAEGKSNFGMPFVRRMNCSFVFPSSNPDRPGKGEGIPDQGDVGRLKEELARCQKQLTQCEIKVKEYEDKMRRANRNERRLKLNVDQLNDLVGNLRSKILDIRQVQP